VREAGTDLPSEFLTGPKSRDKDPALARERQDFTYPKRDRTVSRTPPEVPLRQFEGLAGVTAEGGGPGAATVLGGEATDRRRSTIRNGAAGTEGSRRWLGLGGNAVLEHSCASQGVDDGQRAVAGRGVSREWQWPAGARCANRSAVAGDSRDE